MNRSVLLSLWICLLLCQFLYLSRMFICWSFIFSFFLEKRLWYWIHLFEFMNTKWMIFWTRWSMCWDKTVYSAKCPKGTTETEMIFSLRSWICLSSSVFSWYRLSICDCKSNAGISVWIEASAVFMLVRASVGGLWAIEKYEDVIMKTEYLKRHERTTMNTTNTEDRRGHGLSSGDIKRRQ